MQGTTQDCDLGDEENSDHTFYASGNCCTVFKVVQCTKGGSAINMGLHCEMGVILKSEIMRMKKKQ